MTVSLIRGNALDLPLGDDTVDLVVTSPPYFALRSYQDGGVHYPGQLGAEATPPAFVDALIAATREMIRVTKPTGSIWVNLGDKYSTYAANRSSGRTSLQGSTDRSRPVVARKNGLDGGGEIPAKSLMGIPWRYANRVVDDLGLILRAEVIWSKPNGLPESVTDRVRRSHETWFHFTRGPRYFSAVDEVREPHSGGSHHGRKDGATTDWANRIVANGDRAGVLGSTNPSMFNPLGKLPGSVWTIPTQPLTVPPELGVDHFAAFPMEWPRRIIRGWSPSGICTVCGEGRRPVAHTEKETFYGAGRHRSGAQQVKDGAATVGWAMDEKWRSTTTITGYACACPEPTAPTRRAVILDPFGGTGTTALVAHVNGRHGVTVDLSSDYLRLARWRTTDPAQLAAAAQVDKPPPIPKGQESLFEFGETR